VADRRKWLWWSTGLPVLETSRTDQDADTISATLLAVFVLAAAPAFAQRYSSQQSADVVQLHDTKTDTVVSILTAVGNIAFEMNVKGQNVLYWPYSSIEEFKAWPGMSGIPFVGPWIDRLDEPAFFANGRRYAFDMQLGNVRGEMPIHGFVTTTDQWKVVEARADSDAAWVTSRLEFYRQPTWMKQWPFAHAIEITHRLQDGVLEVQTTIVNMSAEPMPVAIGFDPYYQLTDSPRDDWTARHTSRWAEPCPESGWLSLSSPLRLE
jgi:aldose 1-epimerase